MPEQEILLELPEQPAPATPRPPAQPPRLKFKVINRNQKTWVPLDVEELIPEDHPARGIWELTGKLDLSRFAERTKSAEGNPGAPGWDPQLLVSVWVYALSEGITAARDVERHMKFLPGLRWLGGLEVINYHTLNDFRKDYGEELNQLFVQLLVALEQAGCVNLERVMHDGTKVRAQAGVDSFRREMSVREKLEQVRELVGQDPAGESGSRRQEAARQRAAREREQRLEQALEELEKIRENKDREEEKSRARVSVTEPEARHMKHGDNAILPSYNVQVSTDASAGVIVGMHVTQSSDDAHAMKAALEEVEKNLGRLPQQVVADGGYTNRETIEHTEQCQVDFYGSLPDPAERSRAAMKAAGIDPKYAPHFFIFQPGPNQMQCPAGKPMKYVGQSRKRGNRYRQYRAAGSDCTVCPYQAGCCPRKPFQGRMVSRLESENQVVARFREKMKQPEAQQIYKQRGAIAEFPFAQLKERLRMRKFRLRGKRKASLEALWACLTLNVMIWLRRCWKPNLKAAVALG